MSTSLKHKKLSSLSVVIPCYNEEQNIARLITELDMYIPCFTDKYEYILVNDGSTDSTASVISDMSASNSRIRLINQQNLGFGGALNTGLQLSQYEWIFYTDADLQFKIAELKKLVSHSSKHSLIIGYRKKRAEGFKRAFFAKGLKIWNVIMLGFPTDIKDIDCAFKLIHNSIVKVVGPLKSKGNLVSTELLFKAINCGFEPKQVGVMHKNRKFGVSKCGGWRNVARVVYETVALVISGDLTASNKNLTGKISSSTIKQ